MKLGISTYSLHKAFVKGEMTIPDIIRYSAELGAKHVEIVPLGYSLTGEQASWIEEIKQTAAECGIELSNYAIAANFADLDEEATAIEIERVMSEVDVAARLGVQKMRFDIAFSTDTSLEHYIQELPRYVAICQQLADYALEYNITMSIENHGLFVQQSDRVYTLVNRVNRPNFKTTLDVGNFLCVDENPLCAIARNLPIASMVHLKDFYYRDKDLQLGDGWFQSTGGNWLRGAIVGQGDLNMPKIIKMIKMSGYDGFISIEFEGMEDCKLGTKLAFEYVQRVWDSI